MNTWVAESTEDGYVARPKWCRPGQRGRTEIGVSGDGVTYMDLLCEIDAVENSRPFNIEYQT